MSFVVKLTGLLVAVLGLFQLTLAIPKGLATPSASFPTTDLTLLQNNLGELRIRLLSLQLQPFRQMFKDPVSSRGKVEVYLLVEDMEAVPEKIQLAWDDQPVTSIEYNPPRQAALAHGGADKLMTLETNPGLHTLGVHYARGVPSRDHSLFVSAIPLQKKNAPMVLLLRPKVLKKGLELEHAMWDVEQKSQTLRLWLQNAIFHYHAGNFEHAAELLLVCLEFQEASAQRAELLLWLGKTYLGWGFEGQAISTLQQLIREFPSDRTVPEAWSDLVKAQYRQGQYDAVTATYTRVGRGFPALMMPEVHYMAGQSFLAVKDYTKAIATLNQIPKNSTHYPYTLYALGQAYLGLGDTFAAQQALKKLIDLNPPTDSKDVAQVARLIEKGMVTLGLMWVEQNRYPEALSVLGMVSTHSPFFDQALFGMGWCYMKLEEHVKAIVAFGDLTERFPESSYAYEARLMMSYSYSKLKAYARAVDSYRKSLVSSSQQVTLLNQRMNTLRQKGIDLSQVSSSSWFGDDPNAERVLQVIGKYQELSLSASKDQGPPLSQDLKRRLKELGPRLVSIVQSLSMESLQNQRQRLEDLSVQAGIGIAKNLVLEKTEFGGEQLVLE